MKLLLVLPIALPLLGAAIQSIFARHRHVQTAISFIVILSSLGTAIAITAITFEGPVIAMQVGAWPPGIAIPFVADVFSGLMLLIATLMVLVSTFFAVASGDDRRPFFHPLVLILMAGVSGAFLTGDLFNLFVFFEVMLIASYVLLVSEGARAQIRAGTVYVTTNLMGSTLLVAGVATVYGAAGTVNLAALAGAGADSSTVALGGAILLVAFSIKSSLAPFHGWLPTAYPVASPAVTALFSGLLTKTGIYALFRVYSLLFPENRYGAVLLVVAGVTMVAGVLGAVGREQMRSILSFHMVSQVGYMVAGLALLGPLGVAAGIFYVLHHITVKASLLLSAGAVEKLEGSGDLRRLSGVGLRRPILAASFGIAALSLAGLPPLSGFWAKLTLLRAMFVDHQYWIAATALVVSILTLLSMIKIWNEVFWAESSASDSSHRPEVTRARRVALVAPAAFLAMISVGIGLWPEGLYALSNDAAGHLLDPSAYVKAVMQP
ncbi:MAG: monovalent cation/H+ antiporter subunit D family protein [Actinomycetota bacterium]